MTLLSGPTPQRFELRAALPTGMTLLEASAGTGKTFTIAALTTRYVAEGVLPIDRLLVITFTRMATGELRDRVRERLVRAHDGLVDVLDGAAAHEDDEIVQLLASAPEDEVRARRDRLGKAIAGFDTATIETTHGFCLQVLHGLGTAGDVDREVTLVEDVSDLMEDVVDDLFLRRFAHKPNHLGFTRSEAMEIARHVLGHPDAVIVPPPSDANDAPSIRRRFAKAVGEEMERRKQALKILTYDDVLSRLRATLFDADRGVAACARLRERYDVVLVDEFQDTDPVQWEIMHKAFGESDRATLVLIGDPKQAIYAFRGADVHTYLRAQGVVTSQWTLDVNWRSDQGLLDAYDALFSGAQLGSAGITYHPVTAAEANRAPRLEGAPVGQPLRVRIVHGADGLVPLTGKRQEPRTADARALIARDVAAEVVHLLEAEPSLLTRTGVGDEGTPTTLNPGHIAVLVRVNKHAVTVRDALHAAGVPAVIGGAGSVFATEPAQEWLRLLEALERPTSRDRAALAAMTCFVGWTAEQVATADVEWEELHWSLHRWAAVLRDRGVASLYETVSTSQAVPARVLGRPSGERFMTDLRHVAQLLHEAGVKEGRGPAAMATWLGRRIHDAERDADNEERTRRLESDADAVQVLTIHRSKGLEFPIVLCPYLWDGNARTNDVPIFHDARNGNVRTIDVAGEGNEHAVHQKLELEEGRGEDLRLLYVALTRARHQAVVWWAGAMNSQHSPLARLLFDRGPDGVVGPYGAAARSDADVEAAAHGLGELVSVERVGLPPGTRWQRASGEVPELTAATFDRPLDLSWRRTSYSSITRLAHEHPGIGSEPESTVVLDEVATTGPTGPAELAEALQVAGAAGASGKQAAPLLLAGMPGGTLVGTVVHEAFEAVAFDARDLRDEVAGALGRAAQRRHVQLGDMEAAVAGLCAVIESPLGHLVDDLALRRLGRADRIDELGFEIPLVGGDEPTGGARLHVGAVADLLEAHLPSEDPVAAYAGRMRALDGDVLRGYLTGSLDLVVRFGGDRFVLADYKTNRLAGPDETLTSWHYRPEAVQAAMVDAHYPLQAVLYAVALHRYLRWRLPGYDPERNLAGVLYLFVRGMSASEPQQVDGVPCGVWSWRPPAALVEALSDLFDRGVVPA